MKEVQARFPEAVFIEVFGHYLPMELTPPTAIKSPLRLVFPFSKGFLRITGKDRVALLNGLCTQDIKRWEPGRAGRCLFTDNHGKVVFDCFCQVTEQEILLVTDPGEEKALKQHIEFYTIAEDVQVAVSQDWEVFFVFSEQEETISQGSLLFEQKSRFGQLQVLLSPAGQGLFEALIQEKIQPIGFELFEEVRPAFGFQRAGVDFNRDHLPQVAGLERAVSFNKGCYLGQEPISRVAFRGHLKNKLVKIKGNRPLESGDALLLQGKQVGEVTSASKSFLGGAYYALAYVDSQWILNPTEPLVCGGGSYELAEPITTSAG